MNSLPTPSGHAAAALMELLEAVAARGAAIALAAETPPPLLHRVVDVASRLGVSRDTVERLISDGDLPTVKVRTLTMVTEQALVDYVVGLARV